LDETLRDRVNDEFRRTFAAEPEACVRAPGRVNLIGEHTDYNDGFVLPMAIDRAVWIAFRKRNDRRVVAHSLDFPRAATFDVDTVATSAGKPKGTVGDHSWVEYLKGVAWALEESGRPVRGWEGVLAGDVPIGAGLSSSAALEMAAARVFAQVSGIPWDPVSMARLGQRAENAWVGVNCGIMDQMISAAGQAGHAVCIDCRSLELRLVPLPPGTLVAVMDTTTRRGLVESAYNERRRQCEAAARFFAVPALRDVSLDQLAAARGKLEEAIWRRARHVVSENDRTLRAAGAMERGDAVQLGRLMIESHASLRDDYSVSSSELDAIVDAALSVEGCFGARMTGAGFGGCAVALLADGASNSFAERIAERYQRATNLTPMVYLCAPSTGASVLPVSDPA
jgi:galactokinase